MSSSVCRGRHGRVASSLALLIGFAAQGVAHTGGDLQFVCLDGEGDAHPVPSAETASDEHTWHGISTLVGPGVDIHACWVWSERCPPVKRLPGSHLEAACSAREPQSTPAFASDLVVRLLNLETSPAGSSRVILTAAPSAMWREVPRSLLPAWSADASVVRLPYDSGPWRVQACTEHGCSRWTDLPDGSDDISLRLDPADVVSYRITADGAPLVGARLSLVRPGRGGLSQTEILGLEQSDDYGQVAFRISAEQNSAAVVSAEGREGAAFLTLRDIPSQVELEPGFVVTGRVVDAGNGPVAARLYGRSLVKGGFGLTQLHEGQTGADGRFRLSGFPAGVATLRAVADEDHELEFARRLSVEGSLDLGDLVLSDVEVVWVRVVDSQRRLPVDGAFIRAADGRVTRTGADGLSGVPIRYGRELQVTGRGYGVTLPRLPAGVGRAPDEPFLIELEPALRVTGVFLAADGITPAAHGRFNALGAMDLLLSGTIAEDGAFAMDLPGGGDWEIELSAGNAGSARLEVTGFGGETIDLGVVRAALSAGVSGYLVGDRYQPLVGASVSSTPPSEAGPLMAPLLGRRLTATSGPEGYFELHGLEAGPVGLRVVAEGYASHRLEISVGSAERIDLGTIELDRGRQVTVLSDTGGGLVELAVGGSLPNEEMTTPLERGAAVFRTVPRGPLSLVVLNEDGQPVCTKRFSEAEGDLNVRCNDRSVQVTGQVTLDGSPVAGRLLWRLRSGEIDVPGGFFRSRTGGLERVDAVSSGLRDSSASLDAGGHYELDSVLPGEWDVLWVPETGGVQEPRLVDVPAGASDTVVRNIAYEGVSVQGTVFDPQGRPAGQATVEAFPGEAPVVSDSRGNFRVLGMRPGQYQVRARWRHLRSDLVDVELTGSGDRGAVELHLVEEPASDRLRLEFSDGSAGFCYLEADNGAAGRLVQVRDGRAEVPLDPPLGELVRAACNADGRWVFGDWQRVSRALEQGLTFDPSASTASLALIGRSRAGGASISTPAGWDLGQLRMWFGGAPTFSAGETIPNLPSGLYLVRRGGESRTVVIEGRRVAEVDLDG